MVELDEQQRLILHRSEKIVFTNKVEDVRPSQAEEVGKGLPWLSVDGIAEAACQSRKQSLETILTAQPGIP